MKRITQRVTTFHATLDDVPCFALLIAGYLIAVDEQYQVIYPDVEAPRRPELVLLGEVEMAVQQRQADGPLWKRAAQQYPPADPESLRVFGSDGRQE